MKYTLTVETDDPNALSALVAACQGKDGGYTETIGGTVRVEPKVAAPAAPTETTPAPAPTEDDDGPTNETPPDVDARGYPWDERIHASSKALNKDGTWRYKRGVDKDLIPQVEAEIAPQSAAPAPVPVAPQPPAPTDGNPMPPVPAAFQRTEVPVPTGDAPAAPAAAPVTYEQVINELTAALEAGKLTPPDLPAWYASVGVSGAHELPSNQPALDAAHAKLAAL